MATHGNISEFDDSREDWTSYTERLQRYFTANDVDNADKQHAILLSACGLSTYQQIRNLVGPAKPTDKSFTQLVELVQTHRHPPPSVTVQRFHFHSRVRRQGESVSAFMVELRKLSEHCEFGESLNDMLRDRLVCGINDQRIQRRLLAEAKLTFTKAFELAQAMEAADRNAKDLEKASGIHAVWTQNKPAGQRRGPTTSLCYRCGGPHLASVCRFKDSECHHCGKKGHIAKACRAKAKQAAQKQSRDSSTHKDKGRAKATHHVTDVTPEDQSYPLLSLPGSKAKPMLVTVRVNDAVLQMEVDTGASASIISEETYQNLWPMRGRPPLRSSHTRLRTYTGEELETKGSITVTVEYDGQKEILSLLVVAGTGPSLLGRDWLHKIRLDWKSLYRLQAMPSTSLRAVLDRHGEVFRDELGRAKGVTATIQVDPKVRPRFFKPRTIPYALKAKVDQELARLERADVIEPIQYSDWAAPIVPVLKRDGSVRICGDYKVTVNRASTIDTYPLPRVNDLFASLAGGKTFSKLDLAHAYQQIPIDEKSQQLVVINTHRGLFRYKRLPFGVASAPAIFQRAIEGILRGIPHTSVYIDDILVTGGSEEEHLHTLEEVLTRLETAGLRLRRDKCAFLLPSIEYLGHKISADGLQPTQEKVRAIVKAPAPQNVSQLRSFLGLVNYYAKFLPQLSSTLSPLYRLLEKRSKWFWGTAQDRAFQAIKKQIVSPCLLTHYDPQQELILACDASPYGVGAVLSHRVENGVEKPVAFASRTLSPAERNYAQLEKEGLAIIFGVRKFHDYLFGRQFSIHSDHKPLQSIFSESRPVPPLASARIQRWALTLSMYDYTISYKPGDKHANADSLSRLPLPESPLEVPPPPELVFMLETLQGSPVQAKQIRQWTDRDPILARVRNLILQGWRITEDEDMRPFIKRKEELSVQDGCVLWGNRVVVPRAGQDKVLEELHDSHPGMSRMKSLARSVVWWPGIDKDIEGKVKDCHQCQQYQKAPAQALLHPWEWPERPWAHIHID